MTATPLPAIDVAPRLDRVRTEMDARDLPALIVTSLVDVRWLTGFTGSAAQLAIGPDESLLITDDRYALQAPAQLADAGCTARVEITRTEHRKLLTAMLGSEQRIGLQDESISWAQACVFGDDWFVDAEMVPTGELLVGLRSVKDDAEVARIERAAAITDAALAEVAPLLLGRPTERDFAFALDTAIRRGGAEGNAFDTIVASGPNGARAHHRPGDRTIVDGDLVVIDVGAMVDGYRSDMTRTFGVGQVDDIRQRMYDVVIASQQAGVDAVGDGVATKSVDNAARQVIVDAGWGDNFAHGTGHGVGLDIHELPRVNARATDVYALGHVATVEPGVYIPDVGGVRIEDTVVVTSNGARRLTGANKTLDPTGLHSGPRP